VKFFIVFATIFFFSVCGVAASDVPYLDTTLKLMGENKTIASLVIGWGMNLAWKIWPSANPTGVFVKIRNFLMLIKEKKIVDKIIDLCDVMLAILDVVIAPVPNRKKK